MEKKTEYLSNDLIDKEASVHIFRQAIPTSQNHKHDFIEIIYVIEGEAKQYINGDCYDVSQGDLLFINYGSRHGFLGNEKFEYVNICFNPEMISDGILNRDNAFAVLQLTAFDEIRRENEGGMVTFLGEDRRRVESLLDEMLYEYKAKRRGWREALKSYMNILFMYILRKTEVSAEADRERGIWDELIEYIDKNLSNDLSLSALAEKCFYNPSYFSRAFKERFNMSLTRYVTEKKVKHALFLLEEGELSSSEIAERSAFSSKSALYRAVVSITGRSFGDIRNEKKGKKSN